MVIAVRMIDADDIVYESIDSTDTLREESYYGTGILAVRKEDIDAMPTIELPERKNGKWIEKEYSPFYCSVCGTYQYSASWEIKNKEYNFCPRCGADMRGESE